MASRRPWLGLACLGILETVLACAGPRMERLTTERFKPLPPNAEVEVYIGRLEGPYQEIAIIESSGSPYVDDNVKKRQVRQLQAKARRLGANGVQDLRILTKRIKGFVIDERVPFASWKQGKYEEYFMRGEAIRLPHSTGQMPAIEDDATSRTQMPGLRPPTVPVPVSAAQAAE